MGGELACRRDYVQRTTGIFAPGGIRHDYQSFRAVQDSTGYKVVDLNGSLRDHSNNIW